MHQFITCFVFAINGQLCIHYIDVYVYGLQQRFATTSVACYQAHKLYNCVFNEILNCFHIDLSKKECIIVAKALQLICWLFLLLVSLTLLLFILLLLSLLLLLLLLLMLVWLFLFLLFIIVVVVVIIVVAVISAVVCFSTFLIRLKTQCL